MATQISTIETLVRRHLQETTAAFWSSAELTDLAILGIKDLWRAIVDLKSEHFLKVDDEHVTLDSGALKLSGVPLDVHKIYLIEPRDTSNTSSAQGMKFQPLDYNHKWFQAARTMDAVDPLNAVVYYAIMEQGSPVNAPVIRTAPALTASVDISFCYCPTLAPLVSNSNVPIPGEADNAVVAWTVAFARAKEREDRSPDPAWLATYATEKQNLLESLGLRQYQEPQFVDALYEEYW